MNAYETFATVENQGQIHLADVPFEAGTRVEITINPALISEMRPAPDGETVAAARDRMRELFQTVTGFRNSPQIPREDLYVRGSLR